MGRGWNRGTWPGTGHSDKYLGRDGTNPRARIGGSCAGHTTRDEISVTYVHDLCQRRREIA